jgi:hypothetical protein
LSKPVSQPLAAEAYFSGGDYLSNKWEEIIVLGGEGGRVSLFGSKTIDDKWIFVKETNETALADFFDDEDLSTLVHQRSHEVTDWEQATALLGRSWFKMRIIFIHPEFKQLVQEAISSRTGVEYLSHWDKIYNADS